MLQIRALAISQKPPGHLVSRLCVQSGGPKPTIQVREAATSPASAYSIPDKVCCSLVVDQVRFSTKVSTVFNATSADPKELVGLPSSIIGSAGLVTTHPWP
jgi:hypothetical protein